jgi:carboxypeptidase C (cathepsin A)
MKTHGIDRRGALALAGVTLIGGAAAHAQGTRVDEAANEARRLPSAATTHHTLELPGRTLHFTGTAGSILLSDDGHAARVELAFAAFQLEGADRAQRPVTFAFNGGPGFSSGWLNVGAVGPWRIAIEGDIAPSAAPEPMPNAETWLDFTDLVFIDPAGTGYSRVLTTSQDVRRRLWSIDGDIEYLAEAVRRWLDRFDRGVSPKYLLGESYGGYRAPRLARELADRHGTGVAGLVLVSPALDFGGNSAVFAPFDHVTLLPSMTAAARAARGPVTRAQLADVEQYARTEFLLDVTRGESDAEAIARRSARVAAFTGLDPALVQRHHGLIDPKVVLRELDRAQGRVGSLYDATITDPDPFPLETQSEYPDPILEGLKAPVSSAMVAIFETRLNWRPDDPYVLGNAEVRNRWDWGHQIWNPPQAVKAMLTALALDPRFSVQIVHGLFDLITPYLGTQFLLDQVPRGTLADRIRLSVLPGGHMFYTNDGSRRALRDEAARLFGAA